MDYVIIEWILNKVVCIFSDVIYELYFLVVIGMVNVFLEYIIVMMVCVDFYVVLINGIENELCVSGSKFVEVFLNDVIVV